MAHLITNKLKNRPVPLAGLYDQMAERWHGIQIRLGFVDALGGLLGRIRNKIPGGPLSVLDAGAGSAEFSLAFSQVRSSNVSFDLLDISSKMLDEGERRLRQRGHRPNCICGDVESRSWDNSRYDIVLVSHLLEHTKSPIETLQALHSALAPNGLLVLVANKPHWCTMLIRLRWGHRDFKPLQMEQMLVQAGFTDIFHHKFESGPPKRLSAGYIAQSQRTY
jgi:2-polyprenyl-3-methyl-5-hydroxy-6-metoxy-1,4-benzoquinol methylase